MCRRRLAGRLDPFSGRAGLDPSDRAEPLHHRLGGLFGVGLGNSVQKHLWLPEAQNDFIFSVLCEELGFVGGVAVHPAVRPAAGAGIVIAVRSPDRFGSLLVVGGWRRWVFSLCSTWPW